MYFQCTQPVLLRTIDINRSFWLPANLGRGLSFPRLHVSVAAAIVMIVIIINVAKHVKPLEENDKPSYRT